MNHRTPEDRRGVEVLGEVLDQNHAETRGKPAHCNTINTFNTFTTPTCDCEQKNTTYTPHNTHNVCAHISGTAWEKGVGGVEVLSHRPGVRQWLINVRSLPNQPTPPSTRLAALLDHATRLGFQIVSTHRGPVEGGAE